MSGRHAGPRPRSLWLTLWTFELMIWRPFSDVVAGAIEQLIAAPGNVAAAIRDEWRFLLHVAAVGGFSALVIFGAVLLQLSQAGQ